MSGVRIVGVFGLSGVGKSTLIAKSLATLPVALHLQASDLIKNEVGNPTIDSETLRQSSSDKVRSYQDILLDCFWRRVQAEDYPLIVFDGHLVIDTDVELVEIPQEVIAGLRPSALVHVEDEAAKIAARRSQDSRRARPARSEMVLEQHQRLSRTLCEAYAEALGSEILICRSHEVSPFRELLKHVSSAA